MGQSVRQFSKKHFGALSMAMLIVLSMLIFSPAAILANEITVKIDEVQVIFEDQEPVIENGRTLVPVRGVFEALGFGVEWNGEAQLVTLTRSDAVILITIDSDVFTTNGVSYMLDVPAQIIGGRTMLPLRAALESVGYSLEWAGDTNTVLISNSVPTPTPEPTPVPTPMPTATPSPTPTPIPTPWEGQAKTNYSSDAKLAIDTIEKTHPIFVDGNLPDNYDKVRAEYLESTSKAITKTEFLLAHQKYVAVLRDGHMGGGFLTDTSMYIDVKWISVNSKLYLTAKDGKPSDIEVTMIGGVPVSEVMKQVSMYYGSENDAALQSHYTVFCRQKEMLWLASCQYNDSITLTLSDGTTISHKFLGASQSSIGKTSAGYVAKHKMVGDVFVLDLRNFLEDKSVDDAVKAIEQAITSGTRKFIVDIRGNGGGSTNVGEKILRAMGITPPQMGIFLRYSDLSRKQFGITEDKNQLPSLTGALNRNNVFVSVLTDSGTYSSATIFGYWIQDGKFGNIVGQPSANAPSAYGEMLTVRLPVSGIDLRVSCKKFLRSDVNADQDTLVPDILVPMDQDAMEYALNEIAKIKIEANKPNTSSTVTLDNASEISALLGAEFQVIGTENSFTLSDGRNFRWYVLSVLGLKLENYKQTEVGNIYNSVTGDVLYVKQEGSEYLLVDLGETTYQGRSGYRMYSRITIK